MKTGFLLGCLLLSLLAVIGLFLVIAKHCWWMLPLPAAAYFFAEIHLRRAR
jgi:hypothetical protein